MKIFNLRFGLATNSSSTHSLIFLSPELAEASDNEDREFGWEYWTAGSKNSKTNYLAHILQRSLMSVLGRDRNTVLPILREFIPELDPDMISGDYGSDYPEVLNGHLDHQSIITLPSNWDGSSVDQEFFQDFRTFLLQDGLTVLGGNDNDSVNHPLDTGDSFNLPIPVEDSSKSWVARKDPDKGYWVLFNKRTGAKIRFSFDKGLKAPIKSTFAELCDLKITQFCGMNCPRCYMDSTTEGKHASMGSIRQIISALRDMRVFEVALGGGEPTSHPEFITILKEFSAAGIVPNFTTKSLSWLKSKEKRELILNTCGAVAYSADTVEDVGTLADLVKKHKVDPNKINVQYILGLYPLEQLTGMVRSCITNKLRLTLLGFKEVGRGGEQPFPSDGWLDEVKSLIDQEFRNSWVRIGIDTAIVARYKEDLSRHGVKDVLYTVEEGKFSCYIDAVEWRWGPSSYCSTDLMRPLPPELDLKKLKTQYRQF